MQCFTYQASNFRLCNYLFLFTTTSECSLEPPEFNISEFFSIFFLLELLEITQSFIYSSLNETAKNSYPASLVSNSYFVFK